MTPAEHATAIERAAEIYARDFSVYCGTQALTDFRVCAVSLAAMQAAIRAGVDAAPAPTDVVAELEEVKTVCAQAYQVVGILLSEAGRFDSPEAEKILDNLGEQRLKHADVLPWASAAPKP